MELLLDNDDNKKQDALLRKPKINFCNKKKTTPKYRLYRYHI